MPNAPTYSLDDIKALVSNPHTRMITQSSRKTAVEIGYLNEEEIADRIQKLTLSDFFKTMKSEKNPSLFQDVYKTMDESGVRIYIKLQISKAGDCIVVSFKRE